MRPVYDVFLGQLKESESEFSVSNFGAVGDGITDDTTALQAAVNAFRTAVNAMSNQKATMVLDLQGKTYKTTGAIDATGIISWGWVIQNGTINANCTGKAALDLTASRGGCLRSIYVYGDETNRPRTGMQSARGTASASLAFCDNMLFDNCGTGGYFSLAGVYFYGQETTTHLHAKYWNRNPDGYAAIHTGYDWETYTSDYQATVTGHTSYINDTYINCDYRYLPHKSATITGITKGVNPTVSAAGHTFSDGDTVCIAYVAGMTQINNTKATVTGAVAGVSFQLSGVDSTAYSTYTSGGNAFLAQTKPTVLFSRGQQHTFDTCYIVNYGTDHLDWRHHASFLTNTNNMFDMLFEGSGSASHIFMNTNGNTAAPIIYNTDIKMYNAHAHDYIMRTDATSVNVRFDKSKIVVSNFPSSMPNPTGFVDPVARFSFYDCEVYTPNRAFFTPNSTAKFRGTHSATDDGKMVIHNMDISTPINGSFTPTVSVASGSLNTYTITGVCSRIGDMVYVQIELNITDKGTATGALTISGLPATAAEQALIQGRENVHTGKTLQGFITGTSMTTFVYDNTTLLATGATPRFFFSGFYRTNVAS